MSTVGLDSPQVVIERLQGIDDDLALRQNELEDAALAWFIAKRDREREHALSFLKAEGPVAAREAVADRDTAIIGATYEAQYEALRAVVRVLETRANIGMAILKSQGRA